ncbi:MAG: flavin reductase family protein [Candidatus Cyclobacteriaceae bacterium M3_2C_046]
MERKVIEKNKITQALRKITYGFYIATAKKDDQIGAGTVCWVSQVSFEPPMVMMGIKKGSNLKHIIEQSGAFAINIVGKAEKPMLSPFFKETQSEDHRINGYKYEDGQLNCPILEGLPAFLECKVIESYTPGDHTIFIGEVVNYDVRNKDAEPLIEWETDLRYGG